MIEQKDLNRIYDLIWNGIDSVRPEYIESGIQVKVTEADDLMNETKRDAVMIRSDWPARSKGNRTGENLSSQYIKPIFESDWDHSVLRVMFGDAGKKIARDFDGLIVRHFLGEPMNAWMNAIRDAFESGLNPYTRGWTFKITDLTGTPAEEQNGLVLRFDVDTQDGISTCRNIHRVEWVMRDKDNKIGLVTHLGREIDQQLTEAWTRA